MIKCGHNVSVIDTNKVENYDKIIFLEYPQWRKSGKPSAFLRELLKRGFEEIYLICLETPAIKPNNWKIERHKVFKKIFTWHDDLIDDKKYYRVYASSHSRNDNVNYCPDKKKLCTLIARNKQSWGDPRELYSKRREIIRWFEQNYPEEFDLFGMGWDEHIFLGNIWHFNLIYYYLRRIGSVFPDKSFIKDGLYGFNRFVTTLRYRGRAQYPSYRGRISSKRQTQSYYKFCICFENSIYPGFITDRIFDCFLSGCVPVYLGDPNITKKVSDNTFIDMRCFKSYNELYKYMKNMSEYEYITYIENIRTFINSKENYKFTAEYYAEKVYSEIFQI